jgi:dUTP pyrophosphatase
MSDAIQHPTYPEIEIKVLDTRLNDWGLPKYQTPQAGAIDLYACIESPLNIEAQHSAVLIPTGIAIHMDNDLMAALVLPRSGLGHGKGLVLGNSIGLIDSDYQNQIFVSAWNRNPKGNFPIVINPGDRIAQLMFVPVVRPSFRIVETFSASTVRGTGGFGSTGVTNS